MFVITRANKFLSVTGEWTHYPELALSFNYQHEARLWARGRNLNDAIIKFR